MVPSSRDGQRTRPPWGAARGATPWATLVAYHVANCGDEGKARSIQVHVKLWRRASFQRRWVLLGHGLFWTAEQSAFSSKQKANSGHYYYYEKKGRAPGAFSRSDSQEAQCFTRSDPAAHPTRASDGGSGGSTSIEYIITP